MNITIGQLIDRSSDHFKTDLKHWLMLSLWFFIPLVVYAIGVLLAPASTNAALAELRGFTSMERAGVIISGYGARIAYLLTIAWVSFLTVKTLQQKEQGKINQKELHSESFKRTAPLAVLTLAKYFLIGLPVALVLPAIGLNLLSVATGNGIYALFGIFLQPLGNIAAIIGIVAVAVYLSIATPAFVLGNLGIVESLTQSYKLVKGQFWAVFFRMLVSKGIFTFASIVLSMLLLAAFGLLFVIIPFTTEAMLSKSALITSEFLRLAPLAVLTPMLGIVDYLVYRDLER